MENEEVIKEEPTTPEEKTEETVPVEEVTETPSEPGSKTDSAQLLKSLKEEREKRRALESSKKDLEEKLEEASALSDEDISDEAKVLKKQITSLNEEVTSIKEASSFERLCVTYPALKDKEEEFKDYRSSEHPGAKIESVAKLYLADNGFFDQPRQGLEKPTGGDKTVPKGEMSLEDKKALRETDSREYKKLLLEGKI